MARRCPKPYKGESRKDFRKRLVELHNSSRIVRMGLKRKIK